MIFILPSKSDLDYSLKLEVNQLLSTIITSIMSCFQRVLLSIPTSRCSNEDFHKKQKRWYLICLLL